MRKGQTTRKTIVHEGMALASTFGLGGLTIGSLATKLNMSKSGLFGHFNSKQRLQLEVLAEGVSVFVNTVVRPAIVLPRGRPRVEGLMENWLVWAQEQPGGCLFVSASAEYDDRPGPVRDALVEAQRAWVGCLRRAVEIAIEESHFRADSDPSAFAFEAYALMLGAHHHLRLLEDPRAFDYTRAAFTSLIRRHLR